MYGLIRETDKGWLQGKPAYVSLDGKFYIAQDYDELDDSQKLMWFVHDDNGFLEAFETLREAADYIKG